MFGEIIGQARPVAILRQAVGSDRMPQAYLFSGPEQVGKTTTAVALAQLLNCSSPRPGPAPEACGQCLACRKVRAGTHPDVRVIAPRSARRSATSTVARRVLIGIERLREEERLYTEVYLKPLEGRFKVYLLTEAECLTPEAAHSLLKLIEEPPPQVVWILTTSNLAAILPTIRSRCQLISFGLVPREGIRAWLQGRVTGAAAAERAELAATLAAGRPGRALQLANDPRIMDARARLYELLARLPHLPPVAALYAAEQLLGLVQELNNPAEETEAEAAEITLDDLLEWLALWFRDLLVWQEGGEAGALVNRDLQDLLAPQVGRWSTAALRRKIHAVQRAQRQLRRNAQAPLTLEVMMGQLMAET
jgi:DNA polymerase-3 subunit delta'